MYGIDQNGGVIAYKPLHQAQATERATLDIDGNSRQGCMLPDLLGNNPAEAIIAQDRIPQADNYSMRWVLEVREQSGFCRLASSAR
jgi:hypothetical protein